MILYIDACARAHSRTRELADAVLSEIEKGDPEVLKVRLYECGLKPLTEEDIRKRDDALIRNDFSDPFFDAAWQFAVADYIIIAAPYWDLSFPAILKLYLETVSVNGITFMYDSKGVPHGLCRAKKLYYVTTSGGEIGDYDFGYDYVKALTKGLHGVRDSICIRAVGLDLIDVDAKKVLDNAKEQLKDVL